MNKPPDWLRPAFEGEPAHLRDLTDSGVTRARMQLPFDRLGMLLTALTLLPGPASPRVRAKIRRGRVLLVKKVVQAMCVANLSGQDQVDVLCLAIADIDGAQVARVFLPLDYPEQVQADGVREMGRLVYVLSQAVAFVDGRRLGEPLQQLGEAYHADFLLGVRRDLSRYRLSAYQRSHLDRWPQGLDTPAAADLLYDLPPEVRA